MIDIEAIRELPAKQQPTWPDQEAREQAIETLEKKDPLVEASECIELTSKLAKVAIGEVFLLQAGSCAESFDDSYDSLKRRVRTMLAMDIVLMYAGGFPVVNVGRQAGQFGKPRSADEETKDGITLPVFRGEIVNDPDFTLKARTPNPDRMVQAYNHSLSVLFGVDKLTKGEFANLEKAHQWNIVFTGESTGKKEYAQIVDDITRAFSFMKASGVSERDMSPFHETKIFSSHEAVILDYELALTRETDDGGSYDSSGHMIWIGERTRDINEAHVEFCANVENPIGVKLGPNATTEEVIALCKKLNPNNIPGRLTFITRMGKDVVSQALPSLIDAAESINCPIVWVCDPMHANTTTDASGRKTRIFSSVVEEVVNFFGVFQSKGKLPGGVHIEMTGDPVTECLGGVEPMNVTDLNINYVTTCDPRLNSDQSIELSFVIAELLAKFPKKEINLNSSNREVIS